jgi:hypothetical protein
MRTSSCALLVFASGLLLPLLNIERETELEPARRCADSIPRFAGMAGS